MRDESGRTLLEHPLADRRPAAPAALRRRQGGSCDLLLRPVPAACAAGGCSITTPELASVPHTQPRPVS
jgi:hypothetical protein